MPNTVSETAGWVVMYENQPGVKGLDQFVIARPPLPISYTTSLDAATLFTKAVAENYAREYPKHNHQPAQVREVVEVTQLQLR